MNVYRLHDSQRDTTIGLWSVLPQLMSPTSYRQLTLQDKISLHFVDQSLVPLMVQENYLHLQPIQATAISNTKQREVKTLEMMSEAAECVAEADLIDTLLHSRQDWSLAPLHAVVGTIMPCFFMQGNRTDRDNFPAYVLVCWSASRCRRDLAVFVLLLGAVQLIHANVDDA